MDIMLKLLRRAPTPIDMPPDWAAPKATIVVIGAPRSGTSLLCALMEATGQLGGPDEFFKRDLRKYPDPSGRDDILHRLRLVPGRASPNGVASFKLFWGQLKYARAKGCDLWRFFPDPIFVRVRREDVLGQGISLALAKQTDKWSSRQRSSGTAHYSTKAISDCMETIIRENVEWDRYLAWRGIVPLSLTYESIEMDHRAALHAIADRAGVSLNAVPALDAAGLHRQRDETNEAWRSRWLAEPQLMAPMPKL
ncbi:MAG: hypothetical protein EOP84_08200 [Verrucomicrobiaceae bacterium]|nr:MAG: hypothetical protein EOP84_08200 [Verrucomicrobiaceae bacterium]